MKKRQTTLLLAAGLLLAGSNALASIHQDHLCNGGGPASCPEQKISWAALGEPLGGRMAGGGFVILGGTPPPSSGNSAPRITDFKPADKSRFYQGALATLSVTAVDSEREPLSYRFLVDGAVLRDWSGASTAGWDTGSAAFGWHILRVEVRDASGTTGKEQRAFVFWRPPTP